MAFGGQVHDRVGRMRGKYPVQRGAVANIGLLERVTRRIRDRRHVFQAGRVGQRIQVDDRMTVANGLPDHGRPDKARAAGDKEFHALNPGR